MIVICQYLAQNGIAAYLNTYGVEIPEKIVCSLAHFQIGGLRVRHDSNLYHNQSKN